MCQPDRPLAAAQKHSCTAQHSCPHSLYYHAHAPGRRWRSRRGAAAAWDDTEPRPSSSNTPPRWRPGRTWGRAGPSAGPERPSPRRLVRRSGASFRWTTPELARPRRWHAKKGRRWVGGVCGASPRAQVTHTVALQQTMRTRTFLCFGAHGGALHSAIVRGSRATTHSLCSTSAGSAEL